MKKIVFIILSIGVFANASAQSGIGTTTPDPSAKLDVSSTNKGFLPPRVTLTSTTDIITIPNPATALLVYNTGSNVNLSAGYYYWKGTNWERISSNGTILGLVQTVIISATITTPSTGTRTVDRTYAVDNGAMKTMYLQLGYVGSAAGSGDYIFSLPTGITFNTNAGYNPIFTGTIFNPSYSAMAPSIIPISGVITQSGAWNQYMSVVPYSSTQYRIVIAYGGILTFMNSGFFATSTDTLLSGTFDIW